MGKSWRIGPMARGTVAHLPGPTARQSRHGQRVELRLRADRSGSAYYRHPAMNTETRSNRGLPAPTGPCAVGRAAYCWDGRQTVSTPEAGDARDLVVWI